MVHLLIVSVPKKEYYRLLKTKQPYAKIFFSQNENRQFKLAPKIPYDLVVERSEATSKTLQFSDWYWPKPFRSLGEGRLPN